MSVSVDSLETSKEHFLEDNSDGEENLEPLLKDKVIKVSYGGEKTDCSSSEFGKSQKLPPEKCEERASYTPCVSCKPTITHCTRQQISRMGRRKVPLHEAKKGETQPPPLTCLPCICNQHQSFKRVNWHPKCEMYEAWTERKIAQQNEAMETLTLDDIIHIHRTCTPGGISYSTQFDAIARRNRDASRSATPNATTTESDASRHFRNFRQPARLQEDSLTNKLKCIDIVVSKT